MILIAFPQFYSTNDSGRIDKKVPLNFDFLKQENSSVILLFFGYAGCLDICPPAMNELSRIYNQLDKSNVKVYFINILDTTNKEIPSNYAKGYHKDFKGVYLDSVGISEVTKTLNLSIVKVNDNEVGHAGHLFVLNKSQQDKEYTLSYIYTTRPFNEKSIIKDIKSLLQNRI